MNWIGFVRRSTAALLAPLALACASGSRGASPAAGRASPGAYDVLITGGRVVDGTGNAWFYGDVGIVGDRIARVAPPGMLANAVAKTRLDARGMVVAPGVIDIQAQSTEELTAGDGRVLGMVTQGVTTMIMGEGYTPAPANRNVMAFNGVTDTTTTWGPLFRSFNGTHGFGHWLEAMQRHGGSVNFGSFVGASTLRTYAKGMAQGAPTAAELDTMRAVMRDAMRDGAFGLASALIYPPGNFATTDELAEAAAAMAPYGGVYITHMRSEGDRFLEALDEALAIGRRGGVPVEIYHLKASGVRNWPKAALAIAKIDSARAAGQDVAADMYAYIAGGTALAACMPPWASANGKLFENLADAAVRARIRAAMLDERSDAELLCTLGTPAGVQVAGFSKPELKKYEGMRLDAIARDLGKEWPDALMDLTVAERGRLGAMFFLMNEENLPLQMRQPWMKFGTDAVGADPDSATSMTHPRTYGNYPRILGRYVREQRVMPLEDAVRKMTSAVADRLSIRDRGLLREGMLADVMIFDPAAIIDRATYERPHQLSVGVRDVFVNGVAVLRDGRHTGAMPGRIVRGPGYGRP